jgi:MFS transporter, PPP family, 3-phenylpropionic acid transporter
MSASLQPGEASRPHRLEFRLSLLFGALFIPNAVYLSFFPLWLKNGGLNPVEISALLTVPVFVRLVTTPLFTYLADRADERTHVLIAICGMSLFFAAILLVPMGYWGLVAVVMGLAIFWSPQVPIADSIALSSVRRYGLDYSSLRIWGSVFFLMSSISAGLIVQRTSVANAAPLIVIGFAIIFCASFIAPRLGRRRQPQALFGARANALRSPRVLLILLATGLIQASHGLMYNFGSIYWQSLGVSSQNLGFLWAVPVFAEIVLFKLYSRLFGGWKPELVLALAGTVAILRWILFSLAAVLGFGFYALAAIQCLHGITFGATYLAQQTFLAHAIPEDRAGSAQGLGVFLHGIIMVMVMFASGPIYAGLGGYGFLAMTGVSGAGIAIAYWFAVTQRKWMIAESSSAP